MIELVGYTATLLAIVQFVPQVARTARTRDLDGVSAMTWAVLAGQVVAWLAFGLLESVVPSILANVVLGGCVVTMLTLLVTQRAPAAGRSLALAATLATVALALALFLPSGAVGAFAAALSTVSFVPQAVVAVRSDDLSGLSKPSWVVGVIGGLHWIVYGLARSMPPIYVSALIATSLSVVVLARILAVERATPVAEPLPA